MNERHCRVCTVSDVVSGGKTEHTHPIARLVIHFWRENEIKCFSVCHASSHHPYIHSGLSAKIIE